jgi:hypothetical protein
MCNINVLLGKTLIKVEHICPDEDEIVFTTTEGEKYKLFHCQDCCEHVYVEDIDGELKDLVGHPILLAEEVSSPEPYTPDEESYTWTFYKLATIRGSVTIRWLGSSNGYYSESVDFRKVTLKENHSSEGYTLKCG